MSWKRMYFRPKPYGTNDGVSGRGCDLTKRFNSRCPSMTNGARNVPRSTLSEYSTQPKRHSTSTHPDHRVIASQLHKPQAVRSWLRTLPLVLFFYSPRCFKASNRFKILIWALFCIYLVEQGSAIFVLGFSLSFHRFILCCTMAGPEIS